MNNKRPILTVAKKAAAPAPQPKSKAGGFAKTSKPGKPSKPFARGAQPSPSPAPSRPVRQQPPPTRAPVVAPQVETDEAGREGVRLSKVMSERGMCSRREADRWIERGWVFVDGERVSELGQRIAPDARIWLAPQAKDDQKQLVTILLHKPVGYVSSQPEPGFTPAVSLISADTQSVGPMDQLYHPSMLRHLAPAGRLDIDSTGLLVLTQDGRIAKQLIGDHSEVEKEYLVRVSGEMIDDGLALLNHGLWLDGKALRPAVVSWLNEDQLKFVLKEGRKRQIRRMCELVGLQVVGLKRVRIGRVKLSDLPLGQWRLLREGEGF